MTPIILASTSPYRKQIFERLQLPFETEAPNIEEGLRENEPAQAAVLRLARQKARAVAERHSKGLVIGSDQLAVLGTQIIGKPHSHEKAVKQLRSCQGNTVTFLTGLSVININDNSEQSCVELFNVHFRHLNDREIENYLLKETPYDCAGSFKSEGLGIALFDRLEGDDPNSLIGLPLIRLIKMLSNAGIQVF